MLAAYRRNLRASPILAVVSGLVIAALLLIVLSPVFLWLLWKYGASDADKTLNVILTDPCALVLVGTVGALGSVISIMLRIRGTDITYVETTDPVLFFFFALFKPVIGAAFALFIYAAISSGLLPLDTSSPSVPWLYIAVAFIAGFSERFVKDFMSSTEAQLGAGADREAPRANGGLRPREQGHERLTVAAAAERMGVSQDAVRKRIQRDTIEWDKDDDGRMSVYLDASETRQATDQDSVRDGTARASGLPQRGNPHPRR
jgi:hypothetical protein